jgi:hypothetical protein
MDSNCLSSARWGTATRSTTVARPQGVAVLRSAAAPGRLSAACACSTAALPLAVRGLAASVLAVLAVLALRVVVFAVPVFVLMPTTVRRNL